jgi:DNA-binding NtrC family response regulator
MAKTRFRYRVLDIMQQALNQKVMEQTERTYISSLLHSTNGRMGIAAKKSGIDQRSLFEEMKKYKLRKEDFRRKV